jgi:hypothetical protein
MDEEGADKEEEEQKEEEEERNEKGNKINKINEIWKETKRIYNNVAKSVMGVKKQADKPWIIEETWKKTNERK